ncbi:replicative DNA helicase [Haliscomenobacter sp.]|uniref:replicative DNA helicase n=1 Tax=Haliscomenobacter sp. TaxID=2717303 RepID=UPI0035931D92
MAEPKDPSIKKNVNLTGRKTRSKNEDLSTFVYGKVPPQAIPLEEAVLGALMIDKDALTAVLDILQPESFYLDAHQLIYRAMLRLFERSQPIDLLTVTEELKKTAHLEAIGGPYYLVELTNKVASSANIEYHGRLIAQKFIQRELIRVSNDIIRNAYEDTTDVFDLLDDAEQGLFSIAEKNMSRSYDTMSSLAAKALKQMEELKGKEDGLTGVPTGFVDLDRITSGWQPSDLIIMAARPGMGKTSLVLSLAKNAALDYNKGVAVFSLEMASIQLAQRLISMESEVPLQKMRNGQLEEDEWKRLKEAIERISDAPVYIDDTPGINIFELRAKCRRMKMQYNIQMIIIDYLQLMSGGGEAGKGGNREQEVSAISRALKGLAKELSVPVIALSQLSRAVETRGGSKRPQLSDLRESGCLTGDARLQDAHTGQFYTIKDLAERPEQEPVWVVSMDQDYQLKPFKLLKAFSSGQKQVFELVTRTGRKIKASSNHPFLKFEGWAPLEALKVGDRIAVPDLINEIANNSALENPIPSNTIWDEIIAINPLAIEEVYDATIEESHNFVANDIIVHNSIEQDADMVTFIYRPEYYQILEDEQGQSLKGIAEIIIAKNRHGAQDTVRLKFTGEFARFSNLDDPDFGSFPSDVFSNPLPSNIITMPSRFNDEEDIPF